jgi:hypothetical protein
MEKGLEYICIQRFTESAQKDVQDHQSLGKQIKTTMKSHLVSIRMILQKQNIQTNKPPR